MDPFTMGSAMSSMSGMAQSSSKSGDLYGGNNSVAFGSFFGDSKSTSGGDGPGISINTWLTAASVAVGALSLWFYLRKK